MQNDIIPRQLRAQNNSAPLRLAAVLGMLALEVPACLLVEPPSGLRHASQTAGNGAGGTSVAAAGVGGDAGVSGDGSGAASGAAAGGAGNGSGGTSAGGTSTGGTSTGGTSTGGTSTGGSGGAGMGGSGVVTVCGNGTVESGEGCDDGNTTAADGCSPSCKLEAGFACTGTRSACNRSCNGLAATCGPNGSADCCASNVVVGGTFYRSYDGITSGYTSQSSPATVSDFRLDKYEISVGRFKMFVAAFAQPAAAQPAAASGKNPNNAADPGWDATWNSGSLATAATLTAAVECSAAYQTYTAGDDSLPMNCLDWFEAEAFCIWDGGRLPTEAEWNYAASGGTMQRVYPWGSAAPDCSYANFDAGGGTNYCVAPGTGGVNRVGSESPKGDGYYGQADLAGNVWEWVQDWYADAYPTTSCTNCANFSSSIQRVFRGGSFTYDASFLLSSFRNGSPVSYRGSGLGARCARTQ